MTLMESKLLAKPPLEKMRPFEWLYWAFLDAGMEREAEGMQWALMSFRGALAEANWQANRRGEVQHQCDLMRVVLKKIASTTQTTGLPWWKIEAREALAKVDAGTTAPDGRNASFSRGPSVPSTGSDS